MTWERRLAAARREARRLAPVDVEVEAAWTWAARAVARREVAETSDADGRGEACASWRAHDDALHEALEHAALVRDGGRTLRQVERAMKSASRAPRRAGEGR